VTDDGTVAFSNDGAIAFSNDGTVSLTGLLPLLAHFVDLACRNLAIAANEFAGVAWLSRGR
jgi:hypothetical protein